MNFAPFSILTEKCLTTFVVCIMLLSTGFSQDCSTLTIPIDQTNLSQCDPVLPDCVDTNLQLDSIYLVLQTPSTEPCVPGTEMLADLYVVINNTTESNQSFGLFGSVVAESINCQISSCTGPLVPMSMTMDGLGLQEFFIGSLTYTCGELINLESAVLASGATCPLVCTDLSCTYPIADMAITPPAVPEECSVTIMVECDDMNPCTMEDFELLDPFTGMICAPCTGSGTADCFVTSLVPCNDNNPCTENDMQSIDACSGDICSPCTGTPIASCSIFINQACNDNDPCTENDVIVLDACSLEICIPCAGTPVMEPICDPNCYVYDPASCSCVPIPVPTCDDNDCSTIDVYDPLTCECVHTDITPDSCDDGLCYTTDYLDPVTCNCVNEPITVDCNDNDCSTEDIYNYSTCECEYIDVCTNVSSGGWIGYDQGNCAAFDPAPIQSLEPALGGCGMIEYMWLTSPINVPYTGLPNSPWEVIQGASGLTYDPPVITEGVVCYIRCARTDTCDEFPGESNTVCITVGTTEVCNDWDCTTEDTFNTETCECEYTTISTPSCDDNNCGTEDSFNAETCECEYTTICENVTFGGTVGANQVSCGPFNPDPINNINLPAGGCGDIEYIWIQSNVNVFSNGGAGSPWTIIPGATGPSFDPGFISQTTYYRRCARSEGCEYYIGESNIITIEVTQSEVCDDANCNTLDTYDPITCECTHIDITPICDDNDCSTEDVYDPVDCSCTHIAITPPDCDDNDCNTEDSYNEATCECVYTIIPPPDCDDNNCATTDLFDVLTCECVNVVNPPIDCNDNDCETIDTYNAETCMCEYETIELPDCDDDDCLTIDEYDPLTCECTYTSIEVDNCDDNDCNTHDSYDTNLCECVYTQIPPPDCDDDNCNTIDSYNSETCLCENIAIEIPDCDDGDCGTEDLYDVTICDCVNTVIPPPDCDDDNCNTIDSYNAETCTCVNELQTPPDCDDNDCNTEDFYDASTCECMNTLIQIPDCDDDNCNTNDFYDSMTCECVNELIPPPNCDDNDCNTNDFYNENTCLCVNEAIPPPDCDDNDCNTHDSYDAINCECVYEDIPPPDCDDDDCNTEDVYNPLTCECEYTDIPVELVCNTVGELDVFLDVNGNVSITPDDIDDGSIAGCEGNGVLTLDFSSFSCNNIGPNEVTLTVTLGAESVSCAATVNVIDNLPPTVLAGFCPPDLTISCTDDTSDLSIYGDIDLNQLDDNCPLAYTVEENSVFDLDICGAGTITRTLTLIDIPGDIVLDVNGDQIVCEQTITVEGDATPLTLSDISFPDSPLELECTDAIPAIDLDNDIVIDDSGLACANITTSVTEEITNQNGDCSYTIERTYVVTDNCQSPPVDFSFTQFINVSDNTAPVLNGIPVDITLDLAGSPDECSTVETITYNVSDNCIDLEDLEFTLDAPGLISQTTIDADGNVSFDVEFCTLDDNVTITFTASDGCGNISTDVMEVTILGGECITYNCQKFIFTLEDDGSSDFNSNDFPVVVNACDHIDVDISYDPMSLTDTLWTLNCDSIVNNGNSPNFNQFLYFFIDGELIDSCRIVVFFTNDPNGDGDTSDGWVDLCGLNSFTSTISGNVMSIAQQPVQNVQVDLGGASFPTVMTDTDGYFAFPPMGYGGNYEIIPVKDDDHLNGVSTLDIIFIQRHILGLEEFNNPLKYIAADANNTASITALDIISIRKLILGINDEFPDNTSWRMIDANYKFADPADPLNTDWTESAYINGFESDEFVEFFGIKVGDVNGSAINQFQSSSSEVRSNKTLGIGYEEKSFEAGEVIELELMPDNIESLQGAQFTLKFNDRMLEVQDLNFENNTLCGQENVHLLDEGLISVSWNTFQAIVDEQPLLKINFIAKKPGSFSEALSLSQDHLEAQSYYNGLVGDLELIPKSAENGDVVLFQNIPNPWAESTIIQYYLPEDQTIELSIYNINGAFVKKLNIDSKKGLNEFVIEKPELNQTGVFYYELKSDKSRQIKKMLILE